MPSTAKPLAICLALTVCLAGCRRANEPVPGLVAEELSIPAPVGTTLLRALTPEETGIDFGNVLSPENQIKYLYNGAGVAAADVDGDGLNDVYIVSEEGPNRLYRNLGGMRFEDITESAGVAGITDEGVYSVAAQFADVNNNGHPDLYVANWRGPSQLFLNDGTGRFTEVTETAGVGYVGGPTSPTFADFDRDGFIDLFVPTYRPIAMQYEQESVRLQRIGGELVVPPELAGRMAFIGGRLRELGEKDLLYRNNGDGTFSEVSVAAGIVGADWGLSSVAADFTGDGWPDLYVTNDFISPDRFYFNRGDGNFDEVPEEHLRYTPMFSMGIDAADIDNDGHMDFFIGDMLSRDHTRYMTQHGMMDEGGMGEDLYPGRPPQTMRNALYVNNGDGTFTEASFLADVAASEWTWTAKFADLDLDGWTDLLITNGMVRDMMDSDYTAQTNAMRDTVDRQTLLDFLNEYPPLVTPDLAFRNNGDLTFSEVSAEWGFDTDRISFGATFSDLDGDGDIDVVVNHLNAPVTVLRNESQAGRSLVRLRGQASNRDGVGARVTLTTTLGVQHREMNIAGGYLSGHAPEITFGLGDPPASILALSVLWPSGHRQHFPEPGADALPVNHRFTITEPAGQAAPLPVPPAEPTLFEEVTAQWGLDFVHAESEFDDFALQPGLPRRLSVLGPGVALADATGDGSLDIFVGGGSGQAGRVFTAAGGGRYTHRDVPGGGDDMAALWWPPGGDRAVELLVTRSTLSDPEAPGVSSRAWNGDLGGLAWAALDVDSGGALAAADVDGDGDLDVFVGGRLTPGRWPAATSSRLYTNENGALVDVTLERAPELLDLGLATGAVWADLDADGDPDLVVATEWGPIQVFENDAGVLRRAEGTGLEPLTGHWNGVAAGDFDGDGRIDLVATNLGTNTRYRASAAEPVVVFAGDLAGDGRHSLLEAIHVDGRLRPRRERSMVSKELPGVLTQFDTFRAFAEADVATILGPAMETSPRYEAAYLEHAVFLNQGDLRFEARALPNLAQASPAFGLATGDFDLDGREDVVIAGNFRGNDFESGPNAGGVGLFLAGNGDGSFTPRRSAASGLFVPEDARGLAAGDLDGDGWPDVVVATSGGPLRVFRNTGVPGRSGLTVRLAGRQGNPWGVGSRVEVTGADGRTQVREVRAGSGYMSQQSPWPIFGLAEGEVVQVEVRWPDGHVAASAGTAGTILEVRQ